MAIADVIPISGETSPVGRDIATLYTARENLCRALQERGSKYEKDHADLIQAAAYELKTTEDAARILQKQTELQTKEKQHADETKAIDGMINAFEKQLDSLFKSHPAEGIQALEIRIKELQRRSEEADSKGKEYSRELNELHAKRRKLLQSRINAAQVSQPSRQPQATEQSQESQQPQPSQVSQQLPTTQQSQERRQPEARQRPRRRRK